MCFQNTGMYAHKTMSNNNVKQQSFLTTVMYSKTIFTLLVAIVIQNTLFFKQINHGGVTFCRRSILWKSSRFALM